jgi:hypothetical protein
MAGAHFLAILVLCRFASKQFGFQKRWRIFWHFLRMYLSIEDAPIIWRRELAESFAKLLLKQLSDPFFDRISSNRWYVLHAFITMNHLSLIPASMVRISSQIPADCLFQSLTNSTDWHVADNLSQSGPKPDQIPYHVGVNSDSTSCISLDWLEPAQSQAQGVAMFQSDYGLAAIIDSASGISNAFPGVRNIGTRIKLLRDRNDWLLTID